MAKRSQDSSIKRILVSRTDSLSNVILTLPIVSVLRESLPETEIAFLVRPYISHVVDRIDQIDRAFTLSSSNSALEVFKEFGPDVILFAHPVFRQALEAVRAGIEIRIGSGYRWYTPLFNRWVYDRRKRGGSHESEFELNMLGPLIPGPFEISMPSLPVMLEAKSEAEAHMSAANVSGRFLVIHPLGKVNIPPYPIDQFAEVAKRVLAARDDISIVITSGHGERSIATRLEKSINCPDKTAIVDMLSPNGVSELLRLATCFVGVASDGAHLASLVRTPVVALYPGAPPDWPQRKRPIGNFVYTLTPESNEAGDGLAKGVRNPEYDVSRIHPDRVVSAILSIVDQT